MSVLWNPWHGCKKYSAGCLNCYVYRGDAKYERDASQVAKTKNFDLPVQRKRDGSYKVPPGTFVWTCFTSDFLLEDADVWRKECWAMIKERSDCHFLFITKRILRFWDTVPADWGDGYDNLTICVTSENQTEADKRLPFFNSLPVKHKAFVHEPLLTALDISVYLNNEVQEVVVGGESGANARECRYEWVLEIRRQCIEKGVKFTFKQTGANFVKDGKKYSIPRPLQHSQAKKAKIDFKPGDPA